jgi:hypothetical protein
MTTSAEAPIETHFIRDDLRFSIFEQSDEFGVRLIAKVYKHRRDLTGGMWQEVHGPGPYSSLNIYDLMEQVKKDFQ